MTEIKTLKKILFYLSKKQDGKAKSTISKATKARYQSVKEALEFFMQLEVIEKVNFDKREFYKLTEAWKGKLEFKKKDNHILMRSV